MPQYVNVYRTYSNARNWITYQGPWTRDRQQFFLSHYWSTSSRSHLKLGKEVDLTFEVISQVKYIEIPTGQDAGQLQWTKNIISVELILNSAYLGSLSGQQFLMTSKENLKNFCKKALVFKAEKKISLKHARYCLWLFIFYCIFVVHFR